LIRRCRTHRSAAGAFWAILPLLGAAFELVPGLQVAYVWHAAYAILSAMRLKLASSLLLAAALAACPAVYAQIDPIDKGHSAHGTAFDIGPRQKPWIMQGIGVAPFPITAKNPEVQQWFNQGKALLHSFWFYEAERAFRWSREIWSRRAAGSSASARFGSP